MFIVIYAAPPFNLLMTQSFIDPFRVANKLLDNEHFRWCMVSETGGLIPSLNGQIIATDPLASVLDLPDIAMVSASTTSEKIQHLKIGYVLRRWERQGAWIGSLSSGAFILADLGLLDGRKATVHFEVFDSFVERYPSVYVTDDTFVIDEKRITCCGGVGSVDLALEIIRGQCGANLANSVSRYMFHGNLRPGDTPQDPNGFHQNNRAATNILVRAILAMKQQIEEPCSIPDLSDLLNVSQRRLQALFKAQTGLSPHRYFLHLRLARAKDLVCNTDMTLSEIALASGFRSHVQFCKAYKFRYGVPPSGDRNRWNTRPIFASQYFMEKPDTVADGQS